VQPSSATGLSGDALGQRFADLSAFLRAHEGLWRPRPFAHPRLPWAEAHPEVAAWLEGLSPAQLLALDRDPTPFLDAAPPAFAAWGRARAPLVAVPALPARAPPLPPRAPRHIPARKWGQIRAFLGAAAPALEPPVARAVDWCAGKGHLGRTLAQSSGLRVDLLERNPALCTSGDGLAKEAGAPLCFHPVDVLAEGRAHLDAHAAAVGLHACGILWRTLLADAAATGAAAAVAPCCYHHLGGARRYVPLSAAGAAASLELTQGDLRLAVAEERVVRPALSSARRREQRYRLGLDLLLREASGDDRYFPQGALPKTLWALPFPQFCLEAAEYLGRPLPPTFDAQDALQAAERRAHQVAALESVRSLFRRPLELWLVLDAALAQQEAGRQVVVGTFCPEAETPRNLMILSSPCGAR